MRPRHRHAQRLRRRPQQRPARPIRLGDRVSGESWPVRQCRESEVQVLDADRTRFNGLESRAFEQPYDLGEIHVAMSVPEVRCEAPSLRLGPGEVNEEYPAAGPDNPVQLRGKFSAAGAAEVMK